MIFKEGEIVNKVLISSLKVAQKPLKSSSKAKKKKTALYWPASQTNPS